MRWRVRPSTVSGSTHVPGDKSIGHRALLLAAIAEGESAIENLPGGADVAATAACISALGVSLETRGQVTSVRSSGSLTAPAGPLDARNSGTTMRLLCGLLAGQSFSTCLRGDASLSSRPMGRVIEPLSQMGATIGSNDGSAPLDIRGSALHGITYRLPVDSAQVKSAVLLAGLFAEGETSVVERVPTRDHTERMLRAAGVGVLHADGTVSVTGGSRPRPFKLAVPGDQSSAAFLLAAGAVTGGAIEISEVGVNPTRLGFVEALRRMGASVEQTKPREEMGEPIASVSARGPLSRSLVLDADDVPALVDELPLVALLATQVDGTTVVRGAQELRVKETDRIAAVVRELRTLGAQIEELEDGFVVTGPGRLQGGVVSSHGDHRLAMMLAIAGLVADGETVVEDVEAANVSFPGFAGVLRALGGSIDEC